MEKKWNLVNFWLNYAKKEESYKRSSPLTWNMTVATVSNYEKGVHTPDIKTLIKLADFYDVSTDYLLQRTNYKANISTLNTRLSPEYTLSDLMNTTLELDRHNTDALLDYYELLTMRNAIKHPK